MRIRVNGQWAEHDERIVVAELLDRLELDPMRVAVERNKQIVRRATFGETQLFENDEIEIVTLVGGG